MGSKKLLIVAGAIVLVASAALLAPGIAAGVPLAPVFPASAVPPDDHPDGGHGNGNAWGHDKDSPDFPGNAHGNGNGNGNGWGHDKDSPDFPGNNGRAHGHDKDSPDFPGNNGNRDDDPEPRSDDG